MVAARKYPIGIQTFSRIISEGMVYVDKTDLVWQLAHYGTFIFLSRPRRFGKSLLTSTLESYFQGKRELFEGLKIMEYEQEWEEYPVLRLDLSSAKNASDVAELRRKLLLILEPYQKIYGTSPTEVAPGEVLSGLILRAAEQTGKQVVVIIDEYDAPLLEMLHEEAVLDDMRRGMQELFQPLKANERYIKFCFITGITKFSQLSIFSTINNIINVTMDSDFAAICGITEQELTTVLRQDIERLASFNEMTYDEMHQALKQKYDGYHFTRLSKEIYNPFSLMKAFQQRELNNWWFESGTPSFLIHQLKQFDTDITSLDRLEVPSSAFDQPTENMVDALPLLYQSGYLTIKDYDREGQIYTLSIPNQEVRSGYAEGLLPAYTGLSGSSVQTSFALKFWRALKKGDIEQAMQEMRSYMTAIPYVEGFKRKLADASSAEGFYEYTMYLIFSMLNVYVHTQVKCAGGRVDMVVMLHDTIYVFEFKTNGSAEEALQQIESKGYAIPYESRGRHVVKIGVKFAKDTRIPEEWMIKK